MVSSHRHAFNRAFTSERCRVFADDIVRRCGVPIEFRLAETPCFFPESLIDDLTGAALAMVSDLLGDPAYRRAAVDVVPDRFRLPNGEALPTFVQMDFGLVRTGDRIEGRLLKLQARPSMYGFQFFLAEASRDTWGLTDAALFPAGIDRAEYVRAVGAAILGRHDPTEVVLLEIDPATRKARPDFSATEKLWGVRTVDVRSVVRRGRHLFYDHDERRVRIRRIYNRVVPQDIDRLGITLPFDYRDDLDVEWAGGPDWCFRVSAFAMPYLRHPWADRRRLQDRVACTPVIDTPRGLREAEVSLMLLREGDGYRLILPAARIARERAAVVPPPDLSWTGASAALIV